ncbi:MAG: hypothetical protein AAGH88_09790 [Planctomycetota bacterium]
MARPTMLAHGPCPFVDEGDGRCSCRMTKQHLAEAFDLCLGGRHFTCPTYHAISWELRGDEDESETELQHRPAARLEPHADRQPSAPAVAAQLTVAGRPLGQQPAQPPADTPALTLRRTGS